MPDAHEPSLRIIMVTRQPLLLAMAIVVGIAALIFAVMIPQAQSSWEDYQRIERERPILEKLQTKVAALDDLPSSPEYAQIEIVNNALPSRKPLLELLVSLNSVSTDTDVQVMSYNLSPGLVATDSTQLTQAPAAKGFDSLKLTMSIEGTFRDLQNFFRRVEEVSPFSTIMSLSLSSSITSETGETENTQDQLFRAELETETYFFTKPIAVKYEDPLPVISDRDRLVLNSLAAFVPTTLPTQTQIQGGGLDDLFQTRPNLQGFEDLQ